MGMQQFKANYKPMEENLIEDDGDDMGEEEAYYEQPEEKDFGKAYQKLVQQMMKHDMGANVLVPEEDYNLISQPKADLKKIEKDIEARRER